MMLTMADVKRLKKHPVAAKGKRPSASLGLDFVDVRCPKDNAPMYRRAAPACWARKGWKTVAKCVRCGTKVGLARK